MSITPLNTNISGTRVYDATPTAAGTDLTTISALLGGDTVSVAGSGAVATKNVGVSKVITNLGTLALAGTDAGNYNLVNGALSITPLNTNISGTRVYDGSATAAASNVGTVSALIGGDKVTVSGTGSVADKNVAVGKAVTNGTLARGGTDAGNYSLLAAGNTMSITPLNTNISGTRVYDATPTAAGTDLTTISALLGGDTVSVAGSGAVATKNVGVSKVITNLGTLALAGTDAGK